MREWERVGSKPRELLTSLAIQKASLEGPGVGAGTGSVNRHDPGTKSGLYENVLACVRSLGRRGVTSRLEENEHFKVAEEEVLEKSSQETRLRAVRGWDVRGQVMGRQTVLGSR